jgi:hypothetical protein
MAGDNRSVKKKREGTGPRTSAGKAISSQNARRHGLTAGPDAGSVQQWFRIILNRPDARLRVDDVLTLSRNLGSGPCTSRSAIKAHPLRTGGL